MSKFERFYLLHGNRVFSNFKLWHLVTLIPLEAQDCFLPFCKSPINISWDPNCQGCGGTLNVCQAMLINGILLKKLLYASDLKWTPLYIEPVFFSFATCWTLQSTFDVFPILSYRAAGSSQNMVRTNCRTFLSLYTELRNAPIKKGS